LRGFLIQTVDENEKMAAVPQRFLVKETKTPICDQSKDLRFFAYGDLHAAMPFTYSA
jgi:hypothetical protein